MKYYYGEGVLQNLVRAYMWLNLAAIGGNEAFVSYREQIAIKMTPEQIAESQKMAKSCQAKNFKGCD